MKVWISKEIIREARKYLPQPEGRVVADLLLADPGPGSISFDIPDGPRVLEGWECSHRTGMPCGTNGECGGLFFPHDCQKVKVTVEPAE